jgi:hypothetical protein
MTTKKKSSSRAADLRVLRLAAMAFDVRAKLTRKEIRRIPSLELALNALDQVLKEMGWADNGSRPRRTDSDTKDSAQTVKA